MALPHSKMRAITCTSPVRPSSSAYPSRLFSSQINISFQRPSPGLTNFKGRELYGQRFIGRNCVAIRAIDGSQRVNASPWDEKPYEIIPGGKKAYLDEQDVVTFLDPPKELIPLDPASYNPAAYLWKKIEDIPEERRHRLLHLLEPRLISRAWGVAGTRYEDPKVAKKLASNLLSNVDGVMSHEFWNCRKSGGPMPIALFNSFKKAIFCGKDGKIYGRFIVLAGFANSFCPLYFMVKQLEEVMSTEQPCDLAYEFGDGLLDLHEYPHGFPSPAKHPYPFNDQVVIYIRHLGPGVLVGQAWQEGKALQQVPQKLCSEILMVKEYATSGENQ
ncbi:hypothetical protein L1049_004544 [Liquidambar formosana]|uniref:Uncharacterized protein n=1 Tax=Liquidambar formosana TaxID=63359 RepID=A0AAP0RU07_LIQFO